MSISFPTINKFSAIISSNQLSVSFSQSSSGTQIMCLFVLLIVSRKPLRLSPLFIFLVCLNNFKYLCLSSQIFFLLPDPCVFLNPPIDFFQLSCILQLHNFFLIFLLFFDIFYIFFNILILFMHYFSELIEHVCVYICIYFILCKVVHILPFL